MLQARFQQGRSTRIPVAKRLLTMLPFVLCWGVPSLQIDVAGWHLRATAWGYRAVGIAAALAVGIFVAHRFTGAGHPDVAPWREEARASVRRHRRALAAGCLVVVLIALSPDLLRVMLVLAGMRETWPGHSLSMLPGGFATAITSMVAGGAAGAYFVLGLLGARAGGAAATDAEAPAEEGAHSANDARDAGAQQSCALPISPVLLGFWTNACCASVLAGEARGAFALLGVLAIALAGAFVLAVRCSCACGAPVRRQMLVCLCACWGVIAWNLLGRVVVMQPIIGNLPVEAVAAGWLILLGTCLLPVGQRFARTADAGPQPAGADRPCTADAAESTDANRALRAALAGRGLTEREATVAAAALQGKTSRQVGDELGMSPSTVRNHLSHAYRKCGVAGISELRQLTDAVRVTEVCGAGSGWARPAKGGSCSARVEASSLNRVLGVVRTLFTAAMLAFAAITFIPTGFEQAGWGYGREVVMGFALAPCLAAWLVAHGTERGAVSLRRSVSHAVPLACSMVPALAGVLVCCACSVDAWDLALLVHDPTESLLIVVLSAAFGAGALAVVIAGARGGAPRDASGSLIAATACALLCARIAAFDPTAGRMVLAVLMCLAAAAEQTLLGVAAARTDAHQDEGCVPDGSTPAFGTPAPLSLAWLMTAAAVMGFSYEETWRNSGPFSLMYVMMPLLFAVCAMLVLALTRRPGARHSAFALMVVACVALLWDLPVTRALLLVGGALLGACLACRASRERRDVAAFEVLAVGSSCAAGMVAGDVLVNLWGDVSDAVIIQRGFFEAEPFRLGSSVLAGCVAAWCAIIMIYGAYRVLAARRLLASNARWGEDERHRARAYLVYRGLSPLQVDVLMGICRGQTGRDIARELSYSLGSVNTARAAAYRALGVHSSWELVRLLEHAVSTGVSSSS